MLDKNVILGLARNMNFTPTNERGAAFHVAGVTQVNGVVAKAALTRIGIDEPPQSYDTLRAQYVTAEMSPR